MIVSDSIAHQNAITLSSNFLQWTLHTLQQCFSEEEQQALTRSLKTKETRSQWTESNCRPLIYAET